MWVVREREGGWLAEGWESAHARRRGQRRRDIESRGGGACRLAASPRMWGRCYLHATSRARVAHYYIGSGRAAPF